jgi:hypothetical protein
MTLRACRRAAAGSAKLIKPDHLIADEVVDQRAVATWARSSEPNDRPSSTKQSLRVLEPA